MHISAVGGQGDLHSVFTNCWVYVLSSTTKFSPSPRALSISKNVVATSAVNISFSFDLKFPNYLLFTSYIDTFTVFS